MFNFNEGVDVTVAAMHEPGFAAGVGELPKTLDTNAPGTKVKTMTLFTNFMVLETKSGSFVALPVSNFKTIVLKK